MQLISTCSAAAILCVAAPVAAQGILPYLPKHTMAAMSAPDLAMSMSEFQQMPLAKMWAEEEVQTFFADIMDMAKEQMDEAMAMGKQMHEGGALPIDPAQLLKLRVQGGTLAITSLAMTKGERQVIPNVGLVAHLDFGQSAPTWNMLIQMGMGMLLADAEDDVLRTDAKVGDIAITSIVPNPEKRYNDPALKMGLHMAMVPNGILIGTLAEDVKSIVTNMTSKTPALSTAPGYVAATKSIATAGSEMQMYMAPDAIVDFGMSVMKMAAAEEPNLAMIDMEGISRAITAMGMDDLGTLAMASNYSDGKCTTISSHAHKSGGTAATKHVDMSFLKWVPKDAVSLSSGSMNVTSLYDTLVKGLQAYDANVAEMMLGQLSEMETQLGFTIRNDLFGSLGDHYISWSMPMGTISSAPEVAMLLKVNNQEKLVSALKNMAALTGGVIEIEEGTKRGVKSYQMLVNMDDGGDMGMGINPFEMIQPTFAFKDGYMVIGFSASDVKRVFKRMDREDNPKGDIRGNKEFMAVADTIPEGVTSIAFTDWKANFESTYQLLTGVLAFVPMPEDVPIDMSLLPDSETLTDHLFATVSYTKSDGDGSTAVNVSPFGPELIMAAFAIGVAGGLVGVSMSPSDFR
jgi:hypothetical protein